MESVKIEIKSEPEFIINDNLSSEIEKRKQNQPKVSYHREDFKQEQPVKCEICGKGFKSEDLEIHMTLHGSGGAITNNANLIRKRKVQEKQKVIAPAESFKCKYCGKGFKEEDLLIHESTHIRTVKSIKCTVCSICNKWFDLKDLESHLQSHIRSIAVSKTKPCKDCGVKHLNTCSKSALEIKTEKNEAKAEAKAKMKKIKISEIIIINDNKTIMKIEEDRMINQPENVPVICRYCGKGFKSNDLQLHESLHEMALHKEKEPMSATCNICYKSFESKIQLNLHKIKVPKINGGYYLRCKLNE